MHMFRMAVMGTALLGLLATPAAAQDAKVAKGEALYASQKCALCHAIDGKGNKKFPLDGVGKTATADLVKLWLTDPKAAEAKTGKAGKPAMRSFAKLAADEVDALVAYMLSLK
ncbi:MAG: cytochrome c [Vicinamibacterales bacterium]|nr:cytochrome c [Vicinamibacterales bacterium]